MSYKDSIKEFSELIEVEDFKTRVRCGEFGRRSGIGFPVKGNKSDPEIVISADRLEAIPEDATHIEWFKSPD